MTCQETSNKYLFMKYLNMFIESGKFSPGMTPFADWSFGLKWFKDPLPGESPQATAQSNVIWRAFLTHTLISFKIEAGSKGYGFMSYQPNLVARQLGLSQMVPKPLVSHSTKIIWSGRSLNSDEHKAWLRFHKSTQPFELPVYKFQLSFFTTADFNEWWANYQRQAFSSDIFLQNMIDAFSTLVGDIPPPPQCNDAPDTIIQTNSADEAPKKVTTTLSFFPLFTERED